MDANASGDRVGMNLAICIRADKDEVVVDAVIESSRLPPRLLN